MSIKEEEMSREGLFDMGDRSNLHYDPQGIGVNVVLGDVLEGLRKLNESHVAVCAVVEEEAESVSDGTGVVGVHIAVHV